MNDRLKFRVWNVLKQEFEPENRTHLLGNGELVLIDEWGKTYVKDDPNYKVSFCTGLKDKNGNLIYEGDLVKFKGFDNKHHIGIIKFIDEDSMFALFHTDKTEYRGIDDWDYLSRFRLEVIGNIYENPDMIEEK